jgi:hypothetical protein
MVRLDSDELRLEDIAQSSLSNLISNPLDFPSSDIHIYLHRRFGFPNRDALDGGRTGTDCRGEEHDIIIMWSVTSGKRQIMMDGKEVHYASTRTAVMDHSWSSKGNHVMKVVCHAAAPMTANPGFRQYDLFIDGQSFFTMPKVYELGMRAGAASSGPVPGMSSPRSLEYGGPAAGRSPSGGNPAYQGPRNTDEEDRELQRAINESLEESRRHLEGRGRVEAPQITAMSDEADLFEFDSNPTPYAANGYGSPPPMPPQQQQYAQPPPQQQQYGAPQPQQVQYGAPPPQQQYGAPPPGQPMLAIMPSASYGSQPSVQSQQHQYAPAPVPYQSPPPQQQQSNYAPSPSYDNFAADDAFTPKPPSRNDIANDIMSAYGGSAQKVSPTASAGPQGGMWSPSPQQQQQQPRQLQGQPSPQYQQPQQQQSLYEQQPQQSNGHGGQPGGLSMGGLAQTEEAPVSEMEAAMRKLVNFDRIDEPAEQAIKLTMKKQEDEKVKKNKGHSRGLPPSAAGQVGSAASLSQISSVKPSTPKQTEGIMRAPPQMLFSPGAAQAGALVVHGQGPPPLQQQGQGFGVGYNGGGGGYGGGFPPQQQQQQQYQYR